MITGHVLSRFATPNYLSSGVAAGSGDTQTGTAINLNGDQGALFLFCLGTVSTGGTGLCKVQMSADNGVTDAFADIQGSSGGFTYTASNTLQLIYCDIYRPKKQYLQPVIIRGSGGNTVIAAMVVIVYQLAVAPEGLGTSVASGTWLSNPPNGAA